MIRGRIVVEGRALKKSEIRKSEKTGNQNNGIGNQEIKVNSPVVFHSIFLDMYPILTRPKPFES